MVYSVSYKERKRVFWLFERGIGYRRYCKERIIKRPELQGELPVRDTLVLCDWGRITPVGRNKLPKKSKREQKNTRATYYYQSDSIKENYLFEKETATSSVTRSQVNTQTKKREWPI